MSKPLQHDANLSMSYNELSVNSMENFNDKNISLALINFKKSQTTFIYDKKFCDFDNKETEKDKMLMLENGKCDESVSYVRRKSCEFTRCVSPCVRKARTNLEELQHQINLWSSSIEDCFKMANKIKVDSSDSIDNESQNKDFCYGSEHSSPEQLSAFPEMLTSKTIGNCEKKALQYKNNVQKNCKVVIEEVLKLLWRMEEDRLSSYGKLMNERERVKNLGLQIDKLAFERLQWLPNAVQQEHESCANDINELKWHCAYQGRMESRLRRKVQQVELKHSKILNDLEVSKESCPLVREKLHLEEIAMANIQSKQDETDADLQSTLKQLEESQRKTAVAKQMANHERMLMKKEVDSVCNLLNHVSDELAQLKMDHTSNVHIINDIKRTLRENDEQCLNLVQREERVILQEIAQQQKVKQLQEKIAEQSREHVRLSEENHNLKKENQTMEREYHTTLTKLRTDIKQCTIQLREMSRKNTTLRDDMDNVGKIMEKLKKQRTIDKKAIMRGAQEAEKVKQHVDRLNDECKKLTTSNYSLLLTKNQREEDYFAEQESLRSAEESLRSQLKEELHSKTVLQSRLATDTSDLIKSRLLSSKKKEKVNQQASDAEVIVNNIREQVKELEISHGERQQAKARINETLRKLNNKRDEMEKRYNERIVVLRDQKESFTQKNEELSEKIMRIHQRTEQMTKKMTDITSSRAMMTRLIKSTVEEITNLMEESEEKKQCLHSSRDIENSLQQVVNDTKDRLSSKHEEHSAFVELRKSALQNNCTLFHTEIEKNKRLAEMYHQLNCEYLLVKDLFFGFYEKLVNEEAQLKDHNEFRSLQRRLRECLRYYYKVRGLHNQCHVVKFKLNNLENNDKVFQIQEYFVEVVKNVNKFIANCS